MRNRVLLHRGGEGVASWISFAVILAVLALIMTTLTFPQTASADEEGTSGTPTSARTAPSTPSTSTAPAARASETADPAPRTRAADTRAAESTAGPSAAADPETTATSQAEVRGESRAVMPFAINEDIVVTIDSIVVDGGEPDDQVQVGDWTQVTGTWDASGISPDPAPGDEFEIGFPDELQLPDQEFDLGGEDGTIWAECVVENNWMTCALTDAVIDRPEQVHGTFEVYSRATAYTTAEELPFNANGTVVQGRLPGGGGISDGGEIGDASKSGNFTPDRAAIRWTIDIPGSDLAALDTDNTGEVTLTDELSENMQLCDDRLDARLLSGRPGDLTEVSGGVSITQEDGAGSPVSIDVSNGEEFREDMLYRIQYTSCTTSGEVDLPEDEDGDDVVYSNEVAIGEDTVGVGIGQGWRPASSPSKSGAIASSERYSQIGWTVMVPGSVIAAGDDHEVTIEEELTGAHAVCEDDLGLFIEQSDYLPGPEGGNPSRTTVTDDFTIDTNAEAGDTEFEITFSPDDIESFDEEQYYYVRFGTCLTDDEVPDTGDLFHNAADVNGEPVTASVRGPSFSSGKTGSLNTEPTVVAGEEQPAGSTIDWSLEIPGYHLEGAEEEVTIEDTFSDTLAVCEVGDDLKENLNLSVVARDFLGTEGANPTRDLTDETEVELTDDGFDLTLPMDEDAGDYNREVAYDIDYTLCTSSGGLDARGTEYSNNAHYIGYDLRHGTTQQWGGGGTGTGVARGSFSLNKEIDQFSEEFARDTEFTVLVEEFAPGVDPETGSPEDTYNVTVTPDGEPVTGRNARGTGWQIRLTEIDLPQTGGVYFEQGLFSPGEGVTLNDNRTQALVTIAPRTNVEVELTNRAHHGSAAISKEVTGEGAGEVSGMEFTVNAHINHDGDDSTGNEVRSFSLRDGQSYSLGDLPIGTEVTFTEDLPANTDRITWAEPVFSPETLVIGEDASANAVTVTNTADITQGTFELKKMLTGPEAHNDAVPESFEMTGTWTDENGQQQSETFELPSDGSTMEFPVELPGGTEVTLTETVPEDGDGLAWGTPAFSGGVTSTDTGSAVVTIGQDNRLVKVTNVVDTNDGTLRIVKQLSGEAAEAAEDAEFTVQASWQDDDLGYQAEELSFSAGESTSLGGGIPVGTEVTFTEIDLPEIEDVDWGEPTWSTTPAGQNWLQTRPDGTATAIISDDPNEGRLVTLTNEALWQPGSVEFTKYILDGDDPVPATEADLPHGTDFDIRIDGINPELPEDVDFPAVGETITLNEANNWSWTSGTDLPRDTVITFSEVDPDPVPGISWDQPRYYVAADAGEPGFRDTVEIAPNSDAVVEVQNSSTPIPVVISKEVTGEAAGEVGDLDFTVHAHINHDGDDSTGDEVRTFSLGDGQSYSLGDLPIGTEVTFSEDLPANTDRITWAEPVFSPETLVVGEEASANAVTVTNTADITQGTFELKKMLIGPEAHNDAVPEFFEMTGTWTDENGQQQSETFELPSDGSAVEFPVELPGGTEVTLTESLPEDGDGLAWGAASFGGDVDIESGSAVVTIGRDNGLVKVTNYVDTNDGTLRVVKQLSGEAADAVGDAEFTVQASWQDDDEFREETLTVSEGVAAGLDADDLDVGTQVTLSEPEFPEVDGVEWGEPTWATNPADDSWLRVNPDGTATAIVSDDPNEGRLVTLTNEALWQPGSVEFTKYILDGDDPEPATRADLPEGTEFEVRIDGIDPELPADVDFPAVGETITLNEANDWSWASEANLPRDTVITFSEVDPDPVPGISWGKPFYHVEGGLGEPGNRNIVEIAPGEDAAVEIQNYPIPTTEVDIDKIVTGPKGDRVAGDESTTFQVTASWNDVDNEDRECILNVTPDGDVTPTTECDAPILEGEVQFPLDTEITFVETGAYTGVSNVNWGDVTWSSTEGDAEVVEMEGEPTGATVTLTGDASDPVTLELENETSSRGLIFLPIPIPLPPFDGGSSTPPGPGSSTPPGPGSGGPGDPGDPGSDGPGDPGDPNDPGDSERSGQGPDREPRDPTRPGDSSRGTSGEPGKPSPKDPVRPSSSKGGLAVTGANVVWLGGAALALIAGGAWLTLRNRREQLEEE